MNSSASLPLDHLVYATADLDQAVRRLDALLGTRAASGGQHTGRGTRNALIALSPSSYLEIIAPDATQLDVPRPRWLGVDTAPLPRLVTWAARSADLHALVTRARGAGVQLGAVVSGHRRRPYGTPLEWLFTDPTTVVCDGLVPFFIDWAGGVHPAEDAPSGPSLVGLRAEHPRPAVVRQALGALGLDLAVTPGPYPRLVASLRGSRGVVELG